MRSTRQNSGTRRVSASSRPKRPTRPRSRTKRRRRARKASRGGPWLQIALVLLGAGSLALITLSIHYYGRFNRLMDAFLSEAPPVTSVYARPWSIDVGRRLSLDQFLHRLRRAGYEPDGAGARKTFEVAGDRVRVSQMEGGNLTDTDVVFRDGRVVSVRRNGRDRQTVWLDPPYLSPLFDDAREKRKHVSVGQLPLTLIHAVLVAEDEDFFDHPGISVWGMVRAIASDIRNWNRRQGGSTITQQFVKNYFLSPEKSFQRKLQEIFFAVYLERRFSKPEILGLYANEVYLGQLGSFAIHGFGQGAEAYFGKQVGELTLAECAVLAGIIQAPNRYAPHRNPEAAVQRRNYILDRMERADYISTKDNALASREPLNIQPVSSQDYSEAPYFVDYVRAQLAETLAKESPGQGVAVYSTLDLDLQSAAYEAIQESLPEIQTTLRHRKQKPEVQAALLALEPQTGDILALIGGLDYASAQYNRATRAMRPPGSSFKPFVYAAALDSALREGNSLTLAEPILDEPHTVRFDGSEYSPENFGGKYHGTVTVRQALAQSLNVPTVKIAERSGFEVVRHYAENFGFNQQLRAYPSIALGTFEVSLMELAQGYQVLANRGRLVPLAAIRRIEAEGRPIEPAAQPVSRQVIRPEVAFLVTSALRSTLVEGTGRSAEEFGFDLPAAGKTGSTNDSWFAGYTPELLCVVWVGSDRPPHLELTGAQAALRIWTRFMLKAHQAGYLSGSDFAVPTGVVSVRIDSSSGLLASPSCTRTRDEFFISGTEPAAICTNHLPQTERDVVEGRKTKRNRWSWFTRLFKR